MTRGAAPVPDGRSLVAAQSACLVPGLWVRSGLHLWRRLGTPVPEHLRATKGRRAPFGSRAWLSGLARPGVFRVRPRPVGEHRYPLAVTTYDGGVVLLDPRGGTVRHLHGAGPQDGGAGGVEPQGTDALRERLARHVRTPGFERDGDAVVEEYVHGRPVKGLPAAEVLQVLRRLGADWARLAHAESEGTAGPLLESALAAATGAAVPASVAAALTRPLPAEVRGWSMVPSAADATVKNVVLTEDGPVLIDLSDVRREPAVSYLLGAVADAGPQVLRAYLDGALDDVLAQVAGHSWPPAPWSRLDALAWRTVLVTYLETGDDRAALAAGTHLRWAPVARALGADIVGEVAPGEVAPGGPGPGEGPGPTQGAVVVVSHGSAVLLEQNLTPLSGLPGVTVVVVENSGSASEEARVRELGRRHGWEVLTVPNRGFGAGMNAGVARARAAGAAAHLLLNPDVEADAGTVLALLAHAAAEPDALVTPSVSTPTGRSAFAVGSLDLRTGLTRTREPLDPTHATWVSGACLAVPDALWSRMGGLAEDYFMYWEDLDLSARCVAVGGRIVVRADLTVRHAVGGTQGGAGEPKSALYLFHNARNRLLYARHHLTRRQALRWVLHTPQYTRRLALRDGRRTLARHPARVLLPVLRGTLAGLRLLLGARPEAERASAGRVSG